MTEPSVDENAETPVRPLNWLEQECLRLYSFLHECWEGTGRLTEEGTASYDYFLWRERAVEMARHARSYGRSDAIRKALEGLPERSGIESRLEQMAAPGYEFDPTDVESLRRLLSEDRILQRIMERERLEGERP